MLEALRGLDLTSCRRVIELVSGRIEQAYEKASDDYEREMMESDEREAQQR